MPEPLTSYSLVEAFTAGLLVVVSRYEIQIFSCRKLRKDAPCAACGKMISKGEEAFGELTSSAMNRQHRVHRECFKEKP